jgi:signal transduction histidine kinase/PAS domain-containing protein
MMPWKGASMAAAQSDHDGTGTRWHGCQSVIDALPFYVILVDDQHHVVATNQRVALELGSHTACGGFCPKIFHGLDTPFPGCPLERAVHEGTAVETELFDENKNEWVNSAVFPTGLRTDAGRPVYLHFTRNITDQKRAEEALRQSVEHHKALAGLLERLRDCASPEQTLEAMIDLVLGLSWMGIARRSVAFLARGDKLDLVASRNCTVDMKARCACINRGECLCGRVAASGETLVVDDREIAEPSLRHKGSSDHGHAIVPLRYKGDVIGLANFYLEPGATLGESQRAFLEAAAGVTAAALAEQLARKDARDAQEGARLLERMLLQRTIESQEEERKRVARELHDELGQDLSALLLDLSHTAEEGSARDTCQRVRETIRDLVGKVGRIAWDLRPAILDDYGLESAVARLIAQIGPRSGLTIDYEFVGAETGQERLPGAIELALYRVAQEALTNVIRHAGAKRASVVFVRNEHEMKLLVEDDGRGFDWDAIRAQPEPDRLGLTGMRERLALVGGQLAVESAPGEGTSLKATVPL